MSPFPPPFQAAPAVVRWFRLYCLAMCVLYVLVAGACALFLALEDLAHEGVNPQEAALMRIRCGLVAILSVPLAIVFGAGAFIPRRPWGWVLGIVLIAFGMTSVCCLPATIPLIIFWVKEDARQYYGMGGHRPAAPPGPPSPWGRV